MTTIRWGRGFFRLWLALPVIWIAVTGYMAAVSQERASAAFGALGVVLLPPFFTVLAGLILGWIGRGFLQRPKHG